MKIDMEVSEMDIKAINTILSVLSAKKMITYDQINFLCGMDRAKEDLIIGLLTTTGKASRYAGMHDKILVSTATTNDGLEEETIRDFYKQQPVAGVKPIKAVAAYETKKLKSYTLIGIVAISIILLSFGMIAAHYS